MGKRMGTHNRLYYYHVTSGNWQDTVQASTHRHGARMFSETWAVSPGDHIIVTRFSDRERRTFLLAKDYRLYLKRCFRTEPLPIPSNPAQLEPKLRWETGDTGRSKHHANRICDL